MASKADLEYWTNALRDAERDLDAVTTCTALNLAARRVKLAKAELKRLEAKASA